ncbi:MAG: cbiO2 [Clostridiales bacterium]|jgi:cobalt/nickel transport system ATP-binding protein|nr:cbiO2 [Lachnospiraceae bacterium]MDF2820256.1 cbiO2 [Clostridiales bacterium]
MLKIDNLCFKYSDGNQVLDHLTFDIDKGETVGIIGANGAGKSTLFMTIVGLLLPSEGEITIDGIKLTRKSLREIRGKVGVVFQNPDDQLFMSNVYDDIAFGLRNYGFNEEMIKQKISNIMKILDIERLQNSHSNKLSGGEKRIIAIATILVMEPSVILFDEPTSFLDPKTRRKLIEQLKCIHGTKLIATHDLDMALEVCDKVIILKDGKVFANGSSKEVLTNEALLLDAGLELPFCLQHINR